jgi:fatty-acyl-CoA synthase
MSQESSNPYETGLDKNAANYVPLSPIGFLLRSAAVYPNRTAVIHGERPTYRPFSRRISGCR